MSRPTDAAECKGRVAFLLQGEHAKCPYKDIKTLRGNKVTWVRACINHWHKGYHDEKLKQRKGKMTNDND